jgi:hypothetical protein
MLCRRLERELNAANAIIRQQQLLDEENLRLKERIKRLEEAGDELICYLRHRIKTHDSDAVFHGASITWGKVKKEAKP